MEKFNQLLDKPMDRREFLQHIGVGFVLLFGGSLFFKVISGMEAHNRKKSTGYGSSSYGR